MNFFNSIKYKKFYIVLFLFMLLMNFLFPDISDDFCGISTPGIMNAVDSYFTWNGRLGELIRLFFGHYLFGHVFDIVNSLLFIFFFYLLVTLTSKFLNEDMGYTFICLLLFFISFFSVFGSSFLWTTGSYNYLWGYVIVLLHLSFQFDVINSNKKQVQWYYWAIIIGVSFLAGMSSYSIGAILTVIYTIYIAVNRNSKNIPALFFILGFVTLYFSPGTYIRAGYFDNYRSISDLFRLILNFDVKEILIVYLSTVRHGIVSSKYILLLCSFLSIIYIILKVKEKKHIFFILIVLYLVMVLVINKHLWFIKIPVIYSINVLIFFLYILSSNLFDKFSQFKDKKIEVVCILNILSFFGVIVYIVGILPDQRAYTFTVILCAICISYILTSNMKIRKKSIIRLSSSIGLISIVYIFIQVWSIYIQDVTLFKEVNSGRHNVYIDDYFVRVKSPQYKFIDGSYFGKSKDYWANKCYSEFKGIESISFKDEPRALDIKMYFSRIIELTEKYLSINSTRSKN